MTFVPPTRILLRRGGVTRVDRIIGHYAFARPLKQVTEQSIAMRVSVER